jgi:tagatose-1,6-bisphosphate aldolase non-catalytic subunit AgaZ/GatZ
MISASRNACMAEPNSLAAEGVAARAARIATVGKRIGSTFLRDKQTVVPGGGPLNCRANPEGW